MYKESWMNIYKLFLLLMIILFSGCGSTTIVNKNLSNGEYELLNHIINTSKQKIYYKTLMQDIQKPIAELVTVNNLEFLLCTQELNQVKKISNIERQMIKESFKGQKMIDLKKMDGLNMHNITRKLEKFETIHISYPVIFRSGTMAIYYMSQTYGGGFQLLQKKGTEWESICLNSVWIE